VASIYEFDVKGDRALIRRLRKFPEKLRKKGLRRAARVAMKIVLVDARATARAFDDPNTPQQIWRLITIKEARIRESGVRMRVGIAGGAKTQRGKDFPWYWRLLEFGTERMRAQPFLRPALENNAQAVTERFATELASEIEKLAAAER
jgi:HK97 gp10 family phage protein